MLGAQEIGKRFGFHKATIEGPEATQPRHVMLRRAFLAFVSDLDRVIPDGRYKSLAITAMEEGAMWSHKAVAENAPLEEDDLVETHTEDTMHKVFKALLEAGVDGDTAHNSIREMQNHGILFREFTNKKG